MKTPLAWLNLTHSKVRTAVAVSGVVFAVLLIFVQLGFLGAVSATATLIYDALEFDILIRSPDYLHISDTRTFPSVRLNQARTASPEVVQISPFYIGAHYWRNPRDGQVRTILLMGADPNDPVFRPAEIRGKQSLLSTARSILIDRTTRREFGPQNRKQFSDEDTGVVTEVANNQVQIVGNYELGAGLAADGAILLTDRGFTEVYAGWREGDVSFGLVRLKEGADPAAVAAEIEAALPPDVQVVTRDEVIRRELKRWISDTSIGTIFQLGVVVGVIVGVAIVYQVLSSDVANHISEYATLKAMGYSNLYLAKIVLQQAVALALLGFLPGVMLAEIIYRLTSYFSNLPIENNLARCAYVLSLAVLMCTVSGLGALNKVRTADPADLF
jgi:putative ABC transport system permease protein